MPILAIELIFDNMNVSAQVGDIIYYSHSGALLGGFDQTALANTRRLGPIVEIDGNIITVKYDDTLTSPQGIGAFISFVKDKKVNTSSLLGYYASVNFVNNSQKKIELFSVGAQISESRK